MKLQKANELVNRDSKVMGVCGKIKYYPFVIEKGIGSTVYDVDGNKFIDLLSSAASLNLGHSHPNVIKAIEESISKFTHYTTAYFYNEKAIELAEKVIAATPGDFEKKICFGLTGSDANDGAIKFARGYTGRSKIIAFDGAYHGSTYGSLSLTHISLNMRRKIGPVMPDVHVFDYPNTYHNGDDDGKRCIERIKKAFKTYCPPEEVAAIILEPIQGDAGIIVPPKEFVQGLAALCKEHGILLISEEVQHGYMRTGKMFSIEQFDVVPDLIVLAKPMGGGMPISAVVGRAEVIDSLGAPAHVFTFSGNHVSCASAIATIDTINTPEFEESVNKKGEYLKELLNELKDKYDFVGDVRGMGLSIGVELVKDKDSKESNDEAAAKIIYRAWEKGVILITVDGNVLRIQPPLVITMEEIKEAVSIIDEAMSDYKNNEIPDDVLNVIKGW
ncbi:4-aminobutyrate aminotransferase [Bacilli bacterium PM5-3]|nr:4-aminobutyrate aminotransferase [Bacilli bacterium PM5-3]